MCLTALKDNQSINCLRRQEGIQLRVQKDRFTLDCYNCVGKEELMGVTPSRFVILVGGSFPLLSSILSCVIGKEERERY